MQAIRAASNWREVSLHHATHECRERHESWRRGVPRETAPGCSELGTSHAGRSYRARRRLSWARRSKLAVSIGISPWSWADGRAYGTAARDGVSASAWSGKVDSRRQRRRQQHLQRDVHPGCRDDRPLVVDAKGIGEVPIICEVHGLVGCVRRWLSRVDGARDVGSRSLTVCRIQSVARSVRSDEDSRRSRRRNSAQRRARAAHPDASVWWFWSWASDVVRRRDDHRSLGSQLVIGLTSCGRNSLRLATSIIGRQRARDTRSATSGAHISNPRVLGFSKVAPGDIAVPDEC